MMLPAVPLNSKYEKYLSDSLFIDPIVFKESLEDAARYMGSEWLIQSSEGEWRWRFDNVLYWLTYAEWRRREKEHTGL